MHKKQGIRGNPSDVKSLSDFRGRNPNCARCGNGNVQICHVKPRWAGGKNYDNMISLCQKCHYEFDNLLRKFWGSIVLVDCD